MGNFNSASVGFAWVLSVFFTTAYLRPKVLEGWRGFPSTCEWDARQEREGVCIPVRVQMGRVADDDTPNPRSDYGHHTIHVPRFEFKGELRWCGIGAHR